MLDKDELALEARALVGRITSASDAQTRTKLCRGALPLAAEAVRLSKDLSLDQITEVQAALRTAYRESRGTCRTHLSIAKLARAEMMRQGLKTVPLNQTTKSRVVTTGTASLALSAGPLPEGWWNAASKMVDINAGRYMLIGTGFDGGFTLVMRLLDGDRRYLDPKDYVRVVGSTPDFAVEAPSGVIHFGAAEAVTDGVRLDVAPGRYTGTVTCLRGARSLRYMATLTRETTPPEPLTELVDVQGY